MPLIRPVPVHPASEVGPVHFIAIGGAGMSGIAAMYADLGVRVTGSDQADSAALQSLAAHGIAAHVGHDPAQLGDARTVVVSSAVRESNVELLEARRRGLVVWHRSAALAALMLGRCGVAVTGTHGKTTTTGMTAVLLAESGADPCYVIGSPLTSSGASSHLGAGPAFVIEADESDGSFLQYPARIVVVTNVEADHLDNWGTPEAYAAGFVELALGGYVETVVISADDPGARAVTAAIRAGGKHVVTYGESPGADIRIEAPHFAGARAGATLVSADDSGPLELSVPGRYNLHNATAAYAVGRALDIPGPVCARQRRAFDGTQRRFQRVAEVAGVSIVDDYAHHPTEVVATLTASRVFAAGRRVVACFQPHLFTRTRDFADEFGRALSLADEVVVLGIYPAREDPIPGVTGRLVADAAERVLGASRVHYVERLADAVPALAALVRTGRPGGDPRGRGCDQGGPGPRHGVGRRRRRVSSPGITDATIRLQVKRQDSRRRRLIRLGIGVVVGAILIALVWLLAFSPALSARAVRVTGVKVLTRAQVLDAAAVTLGTPLVWVDPGRSPTGWPAFRRWTVCGSSGPGRTPSRSRSPSGSRGSRSPMDRATCWPTPRGWSSGRSATHRPG